MKDLNIALALLGLVVLLLGVFASPIRRGVAAEPFLALLIGVIAGPAVLGIFDPGAWGNQEVVLEQLARITLAFGLIEIAMSLPEGHLWRSRRRLGVMLGLVMPLMWAVSGLLIYFIFGLPFWVAMLIGAVLTPTDPIIANSIVNGEVARDNVPERVRHLLAAESGLNDGLAYPLVLLPILLLTLGTGEALQEWSLKVVLWEVLAAVAAGAALGYLAGRILRWSRNVDYVDAPILLAYSLALALMVLGAARLIGTDGILAVFVAGLIFDYLVEEEPEEERRIQEAVVRFFTLPIFIVLGAVLPLQEWWSLGWKALAIVAGILLLRRLPAMILAGGPLARLRRKETLFLGWFGPLGAAALYYANLAVRHTGLEEIWVIGSLVIAASITAHGLTATPLTHLYGRRLALDGERPGDQ